MKYCLLLLLCLIGCSKPISPTPDTTEDHQALLGEDAAVLRQLPLLPRLWNPPFSGWEWSSNLSRHIIQTGVATPLHLELTGLPDEVTLLSLSVRWEGAEGHSYDPVQVEMPHFVLFELDENATPSSLGSAYSTKTVRADYEEPHSIDLVLNYKVNLRYRYELFFWGEGGPHFVPEGHLRSVSVKILLP